MRGLPRADDEASAAVFTDHLLESGEKLGEARALQRGYLDLVNQGKTERAGVLRFQLAALLRSAPGPLAARGYYFTTDAAFQIQGILFTQPSGLSEFYSDAEAVAFARDFKLERFEIYFSTANFGQQNLEIAIETLAQHASVRELKLTLASTAIPVAIQLTDRLLTALHRLAPTLERLDWAISIPSLVRTDVDPQALRHGPFFPLFPRLKALRIQRISVRDTERYFADVKSLKTLVLGR